MTVEKFLNRHAERWGPLTRDPMFLDLVETLRSFDPARATPALSAQDATEHTQHLLGRIAGFNLAINILTEGLSGGVGDAPLNATYETDPLET